MIPLEYWCNSSIPSFLFLTAGDLSTLKPRDVETVRCEWVVLDRALDLCPQLKLIHETPAFQENLATLLKEIAAKSAQQVS